MKDPSKKKKRKRDDDGDVTRRKEAKEKSSKKDKKHHKGKREKKEDQRKVSEELLLATGCLNEDQYFEKHAEFSTWLIEEKEMFFNDLSSAAAHNHFLEFVEAWNSRSLKRKFYEGITAAPPRRTAHQWGLGKEKDQPKKKYSKASEPRDMNEVGPEEKQEQSQSSGRLAFGMGSFCPPKNEESNSQRIHVGEHIGPSLAEVGKSAAARMIDGSQMEDTESFAQLKALVDKSSGALQIRKREQ